MKTKQQKRKEALARREANLADYRAGKLPHGCKRTDLARKRTICEQEVCNLQDKV